MTSASSESISYDNPLVGNWRGNGQSNRGMQCYLGSRPALLRGFSGRLLHSASPHAESERQGRIGQRYGPGMERNCRRL